MAFLERACPLLGSEGRSAAAEDMVKNVLGLTAADVSESDASSPYGGRKKRDAKRAGEAARTASTALSALTAMAEGG